MIIPLSPLQRLRYFYWRIVSMIVMWLWNAGTCAMTWYHFHAPTMIVVDLDGEGIDHFCGQCGRKLQIVRPGKWQCNHWEKGQRMLRIRFKSYADDPRPKNWPIKHPYWITGEGEDWKGVYHWLISYADTFQYIGDNWPEGTQHTIQEVGGYTFTDRFPKPDWFDAEVKV